MMVLSEEEVMAVIKDVETTRPDMEAFIQRVIAQLANEEER